MSGEPVVSHHADPGLQQITIRLHRDGAQSFFCLTDERKRRRYWFRCRLEGETRKVLHPFSVAGSLEANSSHRAVLRAGGKYIMDARVTYRLEDAIATIAMDYGMMNALTPQMISELDRALDRAVADQAVVLLTGRAGLFAGGEVSPGAIDTRFFAAAGHDAVGMLRGGFELAERLLSFPTPVVVACSGHALGMGVFLLLAGDYRIGADGAHVIGTNEVAIGMIMPRSALVICQQRLAPAHFTRAVMTAEIYRPAEAVTAGFLDRVVPAANLEREARAAAARLAKLNMAAHAATSCGRESTY
jgi:enoyl-CoA hydratase